MHKINQEKRKIRKMHKITKDQNFYLVAVLAQINDCFGFKYYSTLS